MMKVRQRYRRLLLALLFFAIAGLGAFSWQLLCRRIPDRIQVEEAGRLPELFRGRWKWLISAELCGLDSGEAAEAEATVRIEETGSIPAIQKETASGCEAVYRLFGKIPLKTVSVDVAQRKTVYAGGKAIGIYLQTDGVLVVETGSVTTRDGEECCPAENIVKSGDYIQTVNGAAVSTKEELVECISRSSGEDVVLSVRRDDKEISLRVHPVQDESGAYKAGIWVRNDTQGIGTLTFADEEGNFGALGHGISDVDTGELLSISGGSLYDAEVISVVKGRQGTPGELSGVIHYSEGYKIGTISENEKNGIYGALTGFPQMAETMEPYETAFKQEVQEGEARILCSVSGESRSYQVEIREIRLGADDVNKGMVLEVTDPELLELTGGIVQGMSGSPILQNGRIVGAVTHVLVNDPTRGYGIFIENMLEAAE